MHAYLTHSRHSLVIETHQCHRKPKSFVCRHTQQNVSNANAHVDERPRTQVYSQEHGHRLCGTCAHQTSTDMETGTCVCVRAFR